MLRTSWVRRVALLAAFGLVATACNGEVEEPDEVEEPEDVEEVERADDQLLIGHILPETGDLAELGPPQIESVRLAVEDINAAGGALGNDVEMSGADEAGDAALAAEAADRLLAEGVNAIIGAASSDMSLAFVDAVTDAGVVQCSGSNTSPEFTDLDDNGFYFRTAPTDLLQGPALAEAIIDDGNVDVAGMARQDDYGQGLLQATNAALEEFGANVVADVLYDPESPSFDSEIEQVAAEDPEAVFIVGFPEEGARVLQDLIEAGIGPGSDVAVYAADGMRSSTLWEAVDPDDESVLQGTRGTAPTAEDDEYIERLLEQDGVNDAIFGPQVYDCVIAIALAAEAAGSADPEVYVEEMQNVTSDGTECSSFEECRDLLEEGEDINYQGASGPIAWTEDGDPGLVIYEVWEINEEGEVLETDRIEASAEDLD